MTVPFKFQSAALAREVTARAQLAQAANVLRFDADGWLADNTDGIGLVRDITVNAGFALAGSRVLLIGAGGAAAGVLGPLIAARPALIRVVNRTPAKAHALVRRHAGWAADHRVALQAAALDEAEPGAAQRFDLVLNSSASSLHGAAVPVSAQVLARAGVGHRPDVRRTRRSLPALGPRCRRHGARWPGHAGRTGGRGLLRLARDAAAHRAGAARLARQLDRGRGQRDTGAIARAAMTFSCRHHRPLTATLGTDSAGPAAGWA